MNFQSKHFSLEKVSDGIYAALAKPSGGAFSNSGVIDLGDQTLIFDTFQTPQAAMDLRKFAEQTFRGPITYVVNSHWHGDHVRGNQVFADIPLLTTVETKNIMESVHPKRLAQQKDDITEFERYIATLEEKADLEEDAVNRKSILEKCQGLLEIKTTLLDVSVVLPTMTFQDRYQIIGANRSVELISFNGAHTAKDTMLYLPEDGVMFSGDILVTKTNPYTMDGSPEAWIGIMDTLMEYPCESIIPGHGEIGSQKDLEELKEYLTVLVQYGKTKDAQLKDFMKEHYQSWSNQEMLDMNMEFISNVYKAG